jgi:phosphatidylethanolamine/phosphatidyl-N-methylethanolamine N-methyltransferase
LTRTASRPRRKGAHSALFFREFLAKPFVIGAVAPSSPRLARKMVAGVDLSEAQAVIEYGPGTGAFTQQILRRLPADCRYLAIELSPAMARVWRRRFPRAPICEGSVAHVDRICQREGIEAVDVVFSGLPWASFDDRLQERILEATLSVLRPGGQLITFGYKVGTVLPKGRRFYKRLPHYFSDVQRSEYVWLNLPPAFVVRCTK